ncbi:hypothetical protein R5R35_000368 [Gryllus longicercus]|uniref:GPI alpha-1,4-mannosyltransferase I, catalytic subunit n=1 Tax=Gryllus longicercus TaxID=2509291 RepID=A0AAN9ZG71_9ORTH
MEGIQKHLFTAFTLRMILITYGVFHDRLFPVAYTDIDYKVFTDAARHAWEGRSPYDRVTYRYPPLIAWLLIPNLWLAIWGKLLFSVADVLVGWLIYKLAARQGCTQSKAIFCAKTWLYNPIAIIISTRGNSDALSAALVLSSLLFVIQNKVRPLWAGVLLGLAIHVRLYPIAFSLPMYLCMGPRPTGKKKQWQNRMFAVLWPNSSRLMITLACVFTLAFLTGIGWLMYGWPCLDESILYHLRRRDTRHNFSVYFYLLYLGVGQPLALWQRVAMLFPQAILLFALSVTFGTRRNTLPFCLLTQAIVMVVYNTVVTAQYFVWFLSLLPPIIPFLDIRWKEVVRIVLVWVGAQVTWLVPAYLLEFKGSNSFLHIWFHGLAFFCASIFALGCLIKAYCPPDARRFKWE